MPRLIAAAGPVIDIFVLPVLAAEMPYAGQQARTIKALSDEDIAALRKGEGMGMAKAAELNGYPGPIHVLTLSSELKLTDSQRQQVCRQSTDEDGEANGAQEEEPRCGASLR